MKEQEEVVEEVTEEEEEEKNRNDPLRDRMGFYNFCRSKRKPTKGQMKKFLPPIMEKDEEPADYIKRFEKELGVKFAAIGMMKRPKRNTPCPCKSGKKYKKCCERG